MSAQDWLRAAKAEEQRLLREIMWPLLSWIGLGRLPGDIVFQRGGATFYFPLVTCIIVSIVLSALFWLLSR
jgi:Protein of unknown function (DUF2905)